jgi:hypothetical protein
MKKGKINRLSIFHEGTQPVRVLQHNMVAAFENTNRDFLSLTLDIMQRNGLKPGIGYQIENESVKTP